MGRGPKTSTGDYQYGVHRSLDGNLCRGERFVIRAFIKRQWGQTVRRKITVAELDAYESYIMACEAQGFRWLSPLGWISRGMPRNPDHEEINRDLGLGQ